MVSFVFSSYPAPYLRRGRASGRRSKEHWPNVKRFWPEVHYFIVAAWRLTGFSPSSSAVVIGPARSFGKLGAGFVKA